MVQKFGAKEGLGTVGLLAALGFGLFAAPLHGQAPSDPNEPAAIFEVEVDLVMLNIAVTDQRGRYIRDLSPRDFRITEDGIEQAIASFGEGECRASACHANGSAPRRLGAGR